MKPMIRKEIENLTEKAVKDLCGKKVEIKIGRPNEAIFGDYSTNVAMVFKKNPQEIANAIKSATELPQKARGKKRRRFSSPVFEKIEVKNGRREPSSLQIGRAHV